MIGVDSNVLIRLFVEDNPQQSEAARKFFASRTVGEKAFISTVAIAELVWGLSGVYDYARQDVFIALDSLLDSENVELENEVSVVGAIELARQKNTHIADCIIAAAARAAGCTATVTFDQPASRRIPGMELLA